MIIPKCCKKTPYIYDAFNSYVNLYYKEIKTKTISDKQINSYTPELVLKKRCLVRDRTNASIDIGAMMQVKDAANLKELIFDYFDVTSININHVEWEGSKYDITGTEKIKTFTEDSNRYTAPEGAPFIRIYIGLRQI